MKDNVLKKRKKYAAALLAATAATVATSFSPSAPWVMASSNSADGGNVPDDFNPPIYTEVPHDQDMDKISIPYYNVQAGNNVSVTTNTFVATDYNGVVDATFNNFVVKANDTVIADSGDIVVDKDESENAEKGEENGVTRKYKLKLSDSLKEELKNAAGGGGGAAPSKLEAGTNTTVEGDGTEDNKYKVNINPELTGITSITGDTLTLNGGATTVAINDDGVNVGGKKITNLEAGDVSETSTDAVTGKQLHETNEKIESKLDKDLTNITDDGKKVITGLGTEVVQGDGVTVTSSEDETTGKKTYTISAAQPNFESGTNTTLEGDGTADKPYKYNVNPALTGITSITGDTLTLNGGTTAVAINDDGVNVGGKKITNLEAGDVSETSTDAVTGKQLHETNEKIESKLDKTAERHIKPGDYTVENGTVTLTYVDGDGKDTTETATITGLSSIKSVTSGDEDKLTVANNNGDITVTPVVATDITKADDANKLATAGVVNTAITNATNPLANKNLSNITDDGKKVITGLGTEVVQGNGITVTSSEDAATGKKTYTISANATQPNFANGTNTTVEGDGTAATPYKYNVNPALTGITSITNATTADGDGTKLTIDGDKLSVVNKNGADTATVTIGKDGIDAGGKTITNVADPTNDKDAANKEYVDAQKWGLKVQNGDNPAEAVTAKDKAITLKASADTSDATDTPKKGIVIAKDDEGNITLGLEKADRTTLDNAANIGNTGSDGRDGQAGAGKDGATVAGSAGAQGPTGKDGLNGKDVTSKVNALRNGEAGTIVYTNEAGERVVKANDGKYYPAGKVNADGTKADDAVAVTPEARLVNPDGTTVGDGNKLSNIAPGTVSATSKDAVNGSQLFNERVTSPVIFVDKDGNQVFKTADGKFTTKDGAEITDADELAKIHTKVNADKPMTLDNVNSAVTNLTGTTYLDKLAEGAKADSKVANSAVNVADLHAATTAILDKPITFIGDNDTNDKIERKLGETLKIHGVNNITVTKDATNADTLNVALKPTLTGITSITNAAPVDPTQPDAAKVASTTLTINGDALTVENKQADGTKATVTIGKDGIDAGGKKITNVADPTDDKDVATKKYVDDHAWDLHVDDGTGTGHTVIPKDKVITFKAGTGTIAPTDLPAGQDSPTKDTDGLRPKTGVVVETDKNGTITIGLEEADRKTLDKAANIGNTASDGRDGKAGAGQDGTNVDGTAGAQGPTGKDGLNGKDLTSKVNALRNGEAGTVVYTNEAGERVVKANDGKYYPAGKVNADGTKADDAVAVTPEARLVNPDGTTTNSTTVLNNISSVVTPLAGTDTLEKLEKAAKDDSKVKNAATNVTDLHNTANAIVEKGLTFKGNAGDEIHKNLGEKLDIVGEGTVAADAATAANNIRTKNVDGKLEIGLVKDLKNITSITNAAPVDPAQPDAKVASTTLTIDGDALTVENKQADGAKATVKIGKDGIDAGGKKITNVAEPTENSDVATKEYVDNQAWNLHVDDGTGTGHTVIPRNKVITFKAGTGTVAPINLPAGQDSPTKDTDGLRPKTGVVVETDKNGTITIGLEEADRKTLDKAANIGNTASDGRDGKAGAGQDGVAVAGTAGKEGPTGKDGLNGKDLTSKVNALRNGEAGTVVFTNATGDRLVKANDGNYYKADQVEPNGAPKAGATAVSTKDVTVSLVSPDGTTTGAQNKLSNIADGTVSEKSKDAVNGSQLFNERVTNPTIFVDKDGNQVFKTTDGKFITKDGTEVPAADAGKIHTKLNAGAPMTLDNVASALGEPAKDADYLAKLKEAKEGTTVNNSAVNVTDLHNTANAILEKGFTFEGDTANDTVKRKLGDTLKIHGDDNITVKKDTKNEDTLNVTLQPTLTGITSITNAAPADPAQPDAKVASTTLKIDGNALTVENKQADGATTTVTIGKDGINAGNTKITNVAAGQNDTDVVNVAQLKGLANYTSNVESRVNRLGAQSAAMAGLRHLQYDPLEPTTVMAGVGTYKGQTALALGIAHYKNESLLFHAGASIGSNHDELMANAGVSWKFGSRADETAVKDAYRQGPISSSYTLQDKVSALEAQNQLQKDEINELKAQLAEVLKYVKKG